MASEVDICNLALAHLGDEATVASINPADGSTQAGYCSTFYPIARDALLERHTWRFTLRRATLSLLTDTPPSTWAYVYQAPSDVLTTVAVLDPAATDDYSTSFSPTNMPLYSSAWPIGMAIYSPQPFVSETKADGTIVIYTNVADAVLRYTRIVTDTTKFSPLFIATLGLYLATYLAGPIVKGEAGTAVAKGCAAMAEVLLSQAAVSDANQDNVRIRQSVEWMANR